MLATLQNNPGAPGQTITPPEEGEYRRRQQLNVALGIIGGGGVKKRGVYSLNAQARKRSL